MAISIVGTAGGVGPTTINFTAIENDVVVVATGTIGSNATDVTTAGYTAVADLVGGETKIRLRAKRMSASPDSGVAIGTDPAVGIVYVLRGVHTSSFEDAAAVTLESAPAASEIDPPAITTANANSLVMAFVCGGNMDVVFAGGPSGYSGFLRQDFNGTGLLDIAGAYKLIASAGAENPATFTGPTAIGNDAVMITWAVREAAAAAAGGAKNMLLLGVG